MVHFHAHARIAYPARSEDGRQRPAGEGELALAVTSAVLAESADEEVELVRQWRLAQALSRSVKYL